MQDQQHKGLVAELIEGHMRETPTAVDRETGETGFHPAERRGHELRFGTLLIRVGDLEIWPPKEPRASADWIAHVNIDFMLNEEIPETTISDCATGRGSSAHEALKDAARWWFLASAPTVFSLLAMGPILNARFFGPHDLEGVPGWELFSGPYLWKGSQAETKKLQAYVRRNPLLARVQAFLPEEFERPHLNTIKLYYGWSGREHFASCMVNGRELPTGQEALLTLDWPQLDGYASVSQFVLLIARPDDLEE